MIRKTDNNNYKMDKNAKVILQKKMAKLWYQGLQEIL